MSIKQERTAIMVLLAMLWFMLVPVPLQAQDPPIVRLNTNGVTDVGSQFLVYIDPTGQRGIQDILEQPPEFLPIQSGDLNPGYSPLTYWIRLQLENPGPDEDWYIVGEVAHIQLEAWRITADGATAMSREEHRKDRDDIIPIHLAAGAASVFLLRLRTPYVADLRLKIINRKNLITRQHKQTVVIALIAGCLLSMIVYNLFLFLSLRDRNYFHYLLFALVNSHLNLIIVDFPRHIANWFGWNWWSIMPFYVPMAPMVTFIFARSFLQTQQQNLKLDKFMRAYMGGLVLIMAAAFFLPPSTLLNALNIYMVLGVLLLLLAGLMSLLTGFQPARFFLAGIGTFLVGILVLLLRSLGVLPSNFFTSNAHLMGQAAEMLLMSLALSNRIKLLEAAKTRAEVSAEVKSRLLRIISHDIVTPLTVVKATAWKMKKEVSDPSRVERILRATTIMEGIVSFIRKKEMMESGERLQLGPVILKETFDELAFLFHDRAQEKNIDLQFELEHPDLAVMAEPVSLSNEVLGNLISNAIKFSHPGGPVHIRAKKRPGDQVEISIQDCGIGMDASTVASLFDPAIKHSRPGTQGEKGIGFGMPLAKAYVDAYRGRIEAESRLPNVDQPKPGTTIRIILTAAAPALASVAT
jgi:signal transduction histidine kinase